MSTTKKLIMKKTILVILILLTASEINAQQDPQYTQYMYNMNVINPAYAGSSDATSIGILYRDQWEGLDGAPKTATMNVHFPAGNNVGFGFSAISDEIGPVSETNLYIDFSYTLNLANENRLAFGIKAAFPLLNGWLQDSYPEASEIGTVALSTLSLIHISEPTRPERIC
mgnify:CR=1 FL=1